MQRTINFENIGNASSSVNWRTIWVGQIFDAFSINNFCSTIFSHHPSLHFDINKKLQKQDRSVLSQLHGWSSYTEVCCWVAVKAAQTVVKMIGIPHPNTKYHLWYVSGRKTITKPTNTSRFHVINHLTATYLCTLNFNLYNYDIYFQCNCLKLFGCIYSILELKPITKAIYYLFLSKYL